MAKHQLKLGTRWLSAADVRAFREQARTNRQAQKRLLASLEQKVGARRADIACSLADIPAPQKTNLINKAISGYRSEEHTSELQSLMRNSYAVFCLNKKITTTH